MKLNTKKIVVRLMVLMAFAILMTGCGTSVEDDRQSSASDTGSESTPVEIPAFSLMDMQGNTVTESIFGENKLTLVNVWATFCSPCIDEMPDLETLSQEYGDKEVGFIGIVADGKDSAPQAEELVQDLGITYTNLLPNDRFIDQFLSKEDAVPYTMLVDRKGKVLEFVMGAHSKKELQKLIDSHLSQ